MFSKSFGYALRGILYIAYEQKGRRNIQVEEIARQLALPPHFMSKILKNLVKHKILSSSKGPNGGFNLNETTLQTSVLRVLEVTEGLSLIHNCALRMQECNHQNPCPLHYKMEGIKASLNKELSETSINDLVQEDKADFILSLTSTINTVII